MQSQRFLSVRAAAEIILENPQCQMVSHILKDSIHVMLDSKPEIAVTVRNKKAFLTGWAMGWW